MMFFSTFYSSKYSWKNVLGLHKNIKILMFINIIIMLPKELMTLKTGVMAAENWALPSQK